MWYTANLLARQVLFKNASSDISTRRSIQGHGWHTTSRVHNSCIILSERVVSAKFRRSGASMYVVSFSDSCTWSKKLIKNILSRNQRCPNSTESLNGSATDPFSGSPVQCFTVLMAFPSHEHNLTTPSPFHTYESTSHGDNYLPTQSSSDAAFSIAAGLIYKLWSGKPTSADYYPTALTF